MYPVSCLVATLYHPVNINFSLKSSTLFLIYFKFKGSFGSSMHGVVDLDFFTANGNLNTYIYILTKDYIFYTEYSLIFAYGSAPNVSKYSGRLVHILLSYTCSALIEHMQYNCNAGDKIRYL